MDNWKFAKWEFNEPIDRVLFVSPSKDVMKRDIQISDGGWF
jgi:hypothetical protein